MDSDSRMDSRTLREIQAEASAAAFCPSVAPHVRSASVDSPHGHGFTSAGVCRADRFSQAFSIRARSTLKQRMQALDALRMMHADADAPRFSAIVLAGGVGSRMKADRPKQFLELDGKSIVQRSLDIFLAMEEVDTLVLVVDAAYRDRFSHLREHLQFADPGKERQDSVFNGLQKIVRDSKSNGGGLVAVHDAARPLVTVREVREVVRDAHAHGAAVLGVPSKATIKESEDGKFVLRTIARSRLWEIQTPQVVRYDTFLRGFEQVRLNNLAVTDDASIVEQIGEPVRITMGQYTNIKITTPEDMQIAESILAEIEQQPQ
ncbi:2-C-methyl-D-erythritol 4-phosphate cytidylyltransferase, chloroplastic [Porphyridium purpureum]|uniref:2-C-methyl-D-erythritol 4-phosphate cytidylyltransferase, chloroplastic n=1 Tax=Porphyridium purpureum TaxID=35688 RepID=A0A5J4Z6F8_PORPP|nr:2-C-methyl-D-erythritol 4-phosphate cytidylyltransferase, chloroplastic [Porphyridium purpureum]|eukprot:POR8978..scf295_1